MEVNTVRDLLNLSPTMLLAVGAIWFAFTKMRAYDKHLVECNLKEKSEAVLSYRVDCLENAVRTNHREIMVVLHGGEID